MNRGFWRAGLPCAGLLLFSVGVEAQPTVAAKLTDVRLALPPCPEPPYDAEQLMQQLQLELSARGFRPVTDTATGTAGTPFRVELELPECPSGSGELTLRVLDPDQRSLVQQRLALADTPFEARPRTLALTIAEALGRTGASEPAPAAAAAAAPAEVPAASLPAEPSLPPLRPALVPSDVSPLQLGFAPVYRTPLFESHDFWGGELSASRSITGTGNSLSWLAEAAFATNTTNTRLGDMRTDWWSVGLGLDLQERGALELGVGPRLSLGYLSARPELTGGVSNQTTHAFMLLWGAGAGLALPLGKGWLVRATLDLEQPFRGVVLTAGGERSLSLESWLVSSALGVAFRP